MAASCRKTRGHGRLATLSRPPPRPLGLLLGPGSLGAEAEGGRAVGLGENPAEDARPQEAAGGTWGRGGPKRVHPGRAPSVGCPRSSSCSVGQAWLADGAEEEVGELPNAVSHDDGSHGAPQRSRTTGPAEAGGGGERRLRAVARLGCRCEAPKRTTGSSHAGQGRWTFDSLKWISSRQSGINSDCSFCAFRAGGGPQPATLLESLGPLGPGLDLDLHVAGPLA